MSSFPSEKLGSFETILGGIGLNYLYQYPSFKQIYYTGGHKKKQNFNHQKFVEFNKLSKKFDLVTHKAT